MNGWMSDTKIVLLCYTESQIVMECLFVYYKGSVIMFFKLLRETIMRCLYEYHEGSTIMLQGMSNCYESLE
jgi:hypothetical protein